MRLLKHSGTKWQYVLNPREGLLLRMLVKEFPLTPATPGKINRTGGDPRSAGRERLLNESLGEHRKDLKRQARKLLTAKFKDGEDGWRLSMNLDEREILLQLLNDIRVESWHALGEPENLDALPPQASEADQKHHQLMHVAGYFEWKMVGDAVEGPEARDEDPG